MINYEEWNMDKAAISHYISHLEYLRNSEKSIKIKIGLEVDFFSGKENEIRNYLHGLPLDYIIGSVHYLGEKSVDGSTELYKENNIDRIFKSYFNSVSAAASSGLFDIIGHCDLIRIFGYKPSSDQEYLYRYLLRQ